MTEPWTPRRQGNLGEASAISWLTSVGALVWRPLFESPHYDLIADFDGRLDRVQVKTSTCGRNNRYEVTLVTRGGNQSWNRVVKVIDRSRCDVLFAHVGDGRRWYIPVRALGGSTKVVLGGPKYAEYEVERGLPLPARPAPPRASSSAGATLD